VADARVDHVGEIVSGVCLNGGRSRKLQNGDQDCAESYSTLVVTTTYALEHGAFLSLPCWFADSVLVGAFGREVQMYRKDGPCRPKVLKPEQFQCLLFPNDTTLFWHHCKTSPESLDEGRREIGCPVCLWALLYAYPAMVRMHIPFSWGTGSIKAVSPEIDPASTPFRSRNVRAPPTPGGRLRGRIPGAVRCGARAG